MVSVLPHSKCGMYLITSPMGCGHVLVNGFIGEEHAVKRSDDMVQNHFYYNLSFTKKGGMAYLTDGTGVSDKVWVSGMEITKIAVNHQDGGRVAIHDSMGDRVLFPDYPDVMQMRKSQTLKLTSKWHLVFTAFGVERDLLTSRLTSNAHKLGGEFSGIFGA